MKILLSQVVFILISFAVSGIHAEGVCNGDIAKCTCTNADCTDPGGNNVVPANPECTEFYICKAGKIGDPGDYELGPLQCADGYLLGEEGCQESIAGCDFLNDDGEACSDPGPPTGPPVCNYICDTSGCPTTPFLIASNKGCQYYYDCCTNTEKECPSGSVFNGDVCVPSGGEFPTCCDEMCSVTLDCSSAPTSSTIFEIPDVTNCRQFILCDSNGGLITHASCSEGEVFDVYITECIAGSDCMTYCESSNISPIDPPLVGPDGCYLEIICDGDYVPRCPEKCDETYYTCATGDPIERQCPAGYTFDPTIYTCVVTCTIN